MSGDGVKAYFYLLCRSWLELPRATLPVDEKILAAMAEVTTDKWEIIKHEVMQHFKEGQCTEHKGRLYNEFLLEISRKYENNQRFNNKNANKSRIKREVNASVLANANANANDNTIPTIEEIYSLYPARDRNNNNRSTGKSSRDKLKIRKLLTEGKDLKMIINKYILDCSKTNSFIKNFSTFLNQLPETPPEGKPTTVSDLYPRR